MHLLDCDSSPIQSPLHPSRKAEVDARLRRLRRSLRRGRRRGGGGGGGGEGEETSPSGSERGFGRRPGVGLGAAEEVLLESERRHGHRSHERGRSMAEEKATPRAHIFASVIRTNRTSRPPFL
ncbi:hypothetical protein GW17_00052611 [Ensete ventricosum]|nr:hypothetical protein GW17_00052611 [Ensete ventricosum]